jgi:hypothetical protein
MNIVAKNGISNWMKDQFSLDGNKPLLLYPLFKHFHSLNGNFMLNHVMVFTKVTWQTYI